MTRDPLSFKYNSCRIDVKVAGMMSHATGFLYITKSHCAYDYVLTAKHPFQEAEEVVNPLKLSNLTLYWINEKEELSPQIIDDKRLVDDVLFFEKIDFTIIRIPKVQHSRARRVFVKNVSELSLGDNLFSDSFISAQKLESTRLEFLMKDRELGVVELKYAQDAKHYNGASGSGLYSISDPYLVGVLMGYRLPDFEQKEARVVSVDWARVNERLLSVGWTQLNRGDAVGTKISPGEVLDVRDLSIRGARLDMEQALRFLRHDLADDWFFDPLHYSDISNTDFVLEYFSEEANRKNYEPAKMEVFYLPKKTFVLRKAMVGTFVDRLVYTAAVNCLGPTIEKHLSKFVFSARYNGFGAGDSLIINGVDQWTKRNYFIDSWMEAREGCIVKLDLLNYYDTINKTKLVKLLREIVTDDNEKAAVQLLDAFLKGIGGEEDVHGIPQNCDASSLLATFYVSHVDEIVSSKALRYCRFMDDMFFMASDIYAARDLLQSIERNLREIDLALNAQKVDFFRLDLKKDKEKLKSQLSLYDDEKIKIQHLVRSGIKARRMNGIALLLDQLDYALKMAEGGEEKETSEKDRSLKFSMHALTSYGLHLTSDWDRFYEKLERLTKEQIDVPEQTPLICRLTADTYCGRKIDEVSRIITDLVLRKYGSIYEWQAYHLWMLLAYLKFETPELIEYATREIERNDETKPAEVAAVFIYMVTINPEFSRILLHRLRNGQLHGNFQKRCALIAMRKMDSHVIDGIAKNYLEASFKYYLPFLNKHKEKGLVFFHQISSNLLSKNDAVLFPEVYSGL